VKLPKSSCIDNRTTGLFCNTFGDVFPLHARYTANSALLRERQGLYIDP
jgi:hypothetical protein